MSRCCPYVVVLSDVDRGVLTKRVRGYTERFSVVLRARIVLLAAEHMPNVAIAGRLGLDVDTVSEWRKRFVTEGVDGLRDRKRSGRPRRFAAEVVAGVKAMACEPPSARAVPLARWSSAELAVQAVAEGLTVSVSASTVRRWLGADAIRPWRHRSWIFPQDPEFAVKAGRVHQSDRASLRHAHDWPHRLAHNVRRRPEPMTRRHFSHAS